MNIGDKVTTFDALQGIYQGTDKYGRHLIKCAGDGKVRAQTMEPEKTLFNPLCQSLCGVCGKLLDSPTWGTTYCAECSNHAP